MRGHTGLSCEHSAARHSSNSRHRQIGHSVSPLISEGRKFMGVYTGGCAGSVRSYELWFCTDVSSSFQCEPRRQFTCADLCEHKNANARTGHLAAMVVIVGPALESFRLSQLKTARARSKVAMGEMLTAYVSCPNADYFLLEAHCFFKTRQQQASAYSSTV